MCLAYPGKIIKLNKKTAIVDYTTEQREVYLDPNIPVEVGDWAMVQMRVIIRKLSEKEASEILKAWSRTNSKSSTQRVVPL